ncbi:hypothetical protein PR202_ga13436 [Eleusine coracana subsp. coracana]|uniref:non-specific serine/threonine protein kinase n=1 Tax=Eleusine coracana subsp. coracana TaxID=191504 RepID=A0AAV5CEN6_ELECO|nr:hypothetical protein PR202_ga13436 [Eleusine coracana subsp. coracana]
MASRFSPHPGGVAAAFLLAALHAVTLAQEGPPPWLLCGPQPSSGTYAANDTYQSNINRLAATLPKSTSSRPSVLYAQATAGSVPDVVYALALCRGDANASACESCVATAFKDAQGRCPLVKDVLIFYDLCQLRFSNRNFFPDNDNFITAKYVVGSPISDPTAAFDAAARLLVNATANYAASGNSARRFATGEGAVGGRKIYALSQCAPDKSVDFCQGCFGPIVNQMPNLYSGASGGGVFGTWCTFRYELYPFFSGRPLLQLPPFVGTPPTPAPAPALPATRSQDKSRNKTGTVLAIVMPTIVAVLATTVICFWRRKRRSAAQSFPPYSTSTDDNQGTDMLLVDLSILRVATEDFAESKLLDSERNKELDWGKRFEIINGIARGLQYLHEDSQLKIVHRDLKANNILLDFDYGPKISDFGLAKIFGGDESKYVTRRIAGT